MSDLTHKFDIIVLGMGHQGLIAAARLGQKGFSVCVLDSPSPLAGAAPYEDFQEGVKTGPCAHTAIPLNLHVLEELKLKEYGFEPENLPAQSIFQPLEDHNYQYIGPEGWTGLSAHDEDSFRQLHSDLARFSAAVSQIDLDVPDYTEKGWKDIWAVFEAARHLSSDYADLQGLFAKLMTMSLTDFLNERFESDTLKGLLAFQCTMGSMANPDQPGSAGALALYILGLGRNALYSEDLQPLQGSLEPYFKALRRAASAHGVQFETAVEVKKIIVKNGRFDHIETDNGHYQAPVLISDTNPLTLFQDLIDSSNFPDDFKHTLNNLGGMSGFVRVKAVLNKFPQFECFGGSGTPDHILGSHIVIAPTLNYIREAFEQSMNEGGSQRPAVSMVITSLHNPDLAQEGLYSCSLLGQYFEPSLPDNRDNQIAVAKAVTSAVNDFAPGFTDSIVTFLPVMGDALDKTLGPLNADLTGGNIPLVKLFKRGLSHHALLADNPVEGLYICGYGPESSANPHVLDVGYNTAQYIAGIRKPASAA